MMNGTGMPDPVGIDIGISVGASVIGGIIVAYLVLMGEGMAKVLHSYRKYSDFKKEIRDTVEKMFWDIQGSNRADSEDILKTRTIQFRINILQLRDISMLYRRHLGLKELIEFINLLNTVKINTDDEIRENGHLEEDNYQNILDKFREVKWLKVSVEKLNFKSRSIQAPTHREEIIDMRTIAISVGVGLTTLMFFYMILLMGSVFISTLSA